MTLALQDLWQHLQRQLFPVLTEELGELGENDQQFIQVVALLPLGRFLEPYRWQGIGCPPHERAWLVHAFIAKAVYQFPTTEALVEAIRARPTLRRLCGWERVADVPSLSTFSRAFGRFAADELPQKIHEALVKQHCGPKLVGYTSHDATAIVAPERPAPSAPGVADAPTMATERGLRRRRIAWGGMRGSAAIGAANCSVWSGRRHQGRVCRICRRETASWPPCAPTTSAASCGALVTTFTTPAGKPASAKASTISPCVRGQISDDLRMTALPQASGTAIARTPKMMGRSTGQYPAPHPPARAGPAPGILAYRTGSPHRRSAWQAPQPRAPCPRPALD